MRGFSNNGFFTGTDSNGRCQVTYGPKSKKIKATGEGHDLFEPETERRNR